MELANGADVAFIVAKFRARAADPVTRPDAPAWNALLPVPVLLKVHWVMTVWAEAVEANTLRPIAAIASVRVEGVGMRNLSLVSNSVVTIKLVREMFSGGINVSHAIKSEEACKVVWQQSDESGTGRDESGALGTNRAQVGTNQRRTNAREAVESD
jgi:hypothetical protein